MLMISNPRDQEGIKRDESNGYDMMNKDNSKKAWGSNKPYAKLKTDQEERPSSDRSRGSSRSSSEGVDIGVLEKPQLIRSEGVNENRVVLVEEDNDDEPPLKHRPGPDKDRVIQKPYAPVRAVCQCCYEDISTNTSIRCSTQQHLFCFDCVRRYVQEFIYGESCPPLVQEQQSKEEDPRLQPVLMTWLACLSGECDQAPGIGHLPHEAIEQVASERLWEHYQERIFRLEFSQQNALRLTAKAQAVARGDVKCPRANNRHRGDTEGMARVPHIPKKKLIAKSNTTVKVAPSFTRVQYESASYTAGQVGTKHAPSAQKSTPNDQWQDIKSESAMNNPLDQKYRRVEEAMTESKLRKCPACSTPFLKETGCNKLRCPGCRVCICYICREIVPTKGYDHFCRHYYDTCNLCSKCPLWTSQDEKIDQDRIRQVATNEVHRIWDETALVSNKDKDDKDEAAIALEVERLMLDPGASAAASSSKSRSSSDPPGINAAKRS